MKEGKENPPESKVVRDDAKMIDLREVDALVREAGIEVKPRRKNQFKTESERVSTQKQELLGRAEVLRKKVEKEERKEWALKNSETVFDDPDFSAMEGRLEGLEGAGVERLKIGEKEYRVTDIRDRLNQTRALINAGKDHDGLRALNEHELDSWLAEQGFTRGKVGEASKYGLRDAVKAAIQTNADAGMIRRRE